MAYDSRIATHSFTKAAGSQTTQIVGPAGKVGNVVDIVVRGVTTAYTGGGAQVQLGVTGDLDRYALLAHGDIALNGVANGATGIENENFNIPADDAIVLTASGNGAATIDVLIAWG